MILATLHAVEKADSLFVEPQTGLTRGNLSAHMSKLEVAGNIKITREFVDKIPRTLLNITDQGFQALLSYSDSMKQVLDDLE